MGYFSNSADGSYYRQAYCDRCLHDTERRCPVWLLHLLHNRDEALQPVLGQLIPRTEDGLGNEQCLLWTPRAEATEAALLAARNLIHNAGGPGLAGWDELAVALLALDPARARR